MLDLLANLDDAVDRFTACTLPRQEWTHRAHLAIGMWHVHRYGSGEALLRLRAGIRRLNESHGTLNSATSGYHETITRAYVELLEQFLACCPGAMPLNERVSHLVATPLADKDVLLKFYSRALLMSAKARAEWIEPDCARLQLSMILDSNALSQKCGGG